MVFIFIVIIIFVNLKDFRIHQREATATGEQTGTKVDGDGMPF